MLHVTLHSRLVIKNNNSIVVTHALRIRKLGGFKGIAIKIGAIIIGAKSYPVIRNSYYQRNCAVFVMYLVVSIFIHYDKQLLYLHSSPVLTNIFVLNLSVRFRLRWDSFYMLYWYCLKFQSLTKYQITNKTTGVISLKNILSQIGISCCNVNIRITKSWFPLVGVIELWSDVPVAEHFRHLTSGNRSESYN